VLTAPAVLVTPSFYRISQVSPAFALRRCQQGLVSLPLTTKPVPGDGSAEINSIRPRKCGLLRAAGLRGTARESTIVALARAAAQMAAFIHLAAMMLLCCSLAAAVAGPLETLACVGTAADRCMHLLSRHASWSRWSKTVPHHHRLCVCTCRHLEAAAAGQLVSPSGAQLPPALQQRQAALPHNDTGRRPAATPSAAVQAPNSWHAGRQVLAAADSGAAAGAAGETPTNASSPQQPAAARAFAGALAGNPAATAAAETTLRWVLVSRPRHRNQIVTWQASTAAAAAAPLGNPSRQPLTARPTARNRAAMSRDYDPKTYPWAELGGPVNVSVNLVFYKILKASWQRQPGNGAWGARAPACAWLGHPGHRCGNACCGVRWQRVARPGVLWRALAEGGQARRAVACAGRGWPGQACCQASYLMPPTFAGGPVQRRAGAVGVVPGHVGGSTTRLGPAGLGRRPGAL